MVGVTLVSLVATNVFDGVMDSRTVRVGVLGVYEAEGFLTVGVSRKVAVDDGLGVGMQDVGVGDFAPRFMRTSLA